MTAKDPTATARKAAERKRKREAGLEEVRGIYAPKSEHDKIRAMARMLTQRANM
jgi:hypothetical protein